MGRKKNLLISLIAICSISLLLISCEKQEKIRKYKEPAQQTKTQKSDKRPHTSINMPIWAIPGNWTEVKSNSSIRLATYKTPTESLCTIIMIPGKAGGIRANIARWLKQLKLKDSEQNIQNIIKTAEDFHTIGKLKGQLLDFTTITPTKGASYLIAIVNTKNNKMFIKLQGSTLNITKEKSDFMIFCQSLKCNK